jgi:hypothetical protein
MTISYALEFPSSKLWVAEQLDSVASRYLSHNAQMAAQYVRYTIPGNQEPSLENPILPDPLVQEKPTIQIMPGLSRSSTTFDTAEIDC